MAKKLTQGPKMTPTPEQRATVRSLREGREWTQEDLAARVHVSPATISNLETGERHPQAYTAVFAEVMRALKVPADLSDDSGEIHSRIVERLADLTRNELFSVDALIKSFPKK